MNEQNTVVTAPVEVRQNQEQTYGRKDRVFAVVCFVIGYVYVCLSVFFMRGIGVTLSLFAVLAVQILYLLLSGKRLNKVGIAGYALLAVLALGFSVTGSPFVIFFLYPAVVCGAIYWCYCTAGNTDGYFGADVVFELIKSIFVVPFYNFAAIFCALFSHGKEQGKPSAGRTMLNILIGALIGAIPIAVVLVLLRSDSAFAAVSDKIFELDIFSYSWEQIFDRAVIAVPAAMYLFGMIYGAVNEPCSTVMTAQKNDAVKKKLRVLPRVSAYTVLIPLVVIYLIFFVSQSAYHLSAFSGILPTDYSYAEYARGGFFELCSVAVINLIALGCVYLFAVREGSGFTVFGRVLNLLVCVFTIALVVIDLRKMLLYISAYGMTVNRIITSWFMILLGLIFVAIAVKQIVPRFRFAPAAVCITGGMLLLLAFGNVDATVARYNVNAYLKGDLDTVDMSVMYFLDDSAVEYVLPLLECGDEDLCRSARHYCASQRREINAKKWHEYTVATFIAKQKLKEITN